MNYNKNINKFIKENSIDIDLLMSNNETMVYTKKDISRVIATCGMYKEEIKANISISDVIGKNRGKTQNILSELNDLFDEKNNKYILNKQLLEEYKANYEHNDLRFEIRKYKLNEKVIWKNYNYKPNLLVYKILCDEFKLKNSKLRLKYMEYINSKSLKTQINKSRRKHWLKFWDKIIKQKYLPEKQ